MQMKFHGALACRLVMKGLMSAFRMLHAVQVHKAMLFWGTTGGHAVWGSRDIGEGLGLSAGGGAGNKTIFLRHFTGQLLPSPFPSQLRAACSRFFLL